MDRYKNLSDNIEKFKQDENYIDYFRRFIIDFMNTDPDFIGNLIDVLLEICENNEYSTAKYWCILYKGWIHNIKGNLETAIYYHEKAMDFFSEKGGNNRGRAASYNALLVDYKQIGHLDLSIENGMKAMEFSRNLNSHEFMVAITINTAEVYAEYGDYDEALLLLDKIKMYKYHNRIDYEVEMNIIESKCLLHKGQFEEARQICDKNLKIINRNKNMLWKNEIMSIMAQLSFEMGDYEKGNKQFEEAYNFILTNTKNSYLAGKILLEWGTCNFSIKEYTLAEEVLQKAIHEIKNREYISIKEKVFYKLSMIYEIKNDYENAFKYLKESMKNKELLKDNSKVNLKNFREKSMAYAAEEYKSLYDKIERISNLGKDITANLDIEKCTDLIYNEVKQLVDLDSFAIATYNAEENKLTYILLFDNNKEVPKRSFKAEYGKSLGAYCIETRSDIIINDLEKEYAKYLFKAKVDSEYFKNEAKSIIFIPLLAKNEIRGVMTVQSYAKDAYTLNDLNELKILGSYIGIALQNVELFDKVKYFAEYDVLTECRNRNSILSLGNNIHKKSIEEGKKLSIAMIDVDNFKRINDTYGHTAGDTVLKVILQIIKEYTQKNEETIHIGRYGGEEFIIIFEDMDQDKAESLCEDFRKAVEKTEIEILNNKFIDVTISIGIYEFKDSITFENGIKTADKRLYIAKETGKNRTIVR
ncbi:MAG: GGDEF domain-containing protein [Clostridium sp.]|nr:GGDEF domain-containing protein [Clostridium sp.]